MRPATQQFGVEDRPPLGVTVFSALQHLALIAPIGLVFPLLVAAQAGASHAAVSAILAMSMLALGVATLLQCARWRGVGSGFFAPAVFTAAYLPPSLAAADQGGLPLVCGMTMFAGVCEMLISRALGRLRPYLPTEIAGLAVTMIGVILGLLGFRLLFGLPTGASDPVTLSATPLTAIGGCTLAVIIGLSIWGPPRLRIYAVLVALVAAWIAAAVAGEIDFADLHTSLADGLVRLPRLPLALPTFAPGLAFDFAMAALASSLRAVGDITTCQKINDADWLRPDLTTLKSGALAAGLGTFLAGLLGTVGLNTFSGSVGLSAATGVMARRVGFALGGIFVLLSFVPGASALAESIPMPVTGAILLFAAAFVLLNGIQVILSRLLDNRKTLAIGLGLIFGLSRDMFPGAFTGLPPWFGAIIGSPLAEALLVAIVLNLVFRLGVGARAQLVLTPGVEAINRVHAFCEAQGGAWAARRDVMHRVTTALVEFAESSAEVVAPNHDASIELSFDEFHIDAVIRYVGQALELPPPSDGAKAPDLADTGGLPSHLPLLIIARMADKSSSGRQGDTQWLRLTFVH
ncbi:MAG TPA: solute carrier family 23 protein [Opitutus sp.]|nr:solute carrier family 23 protein [Opitutus sp.]